MGRGRVGAIIAIAVALGDGSAQAQNFPTRSVTLIVPWAAGGPTDIEMRALAAATEKYLCQAIVIEYKPGAAGTLGPIQMAATAAPDGYTIAQISENVFAVPYMRETKFDPIEDLSYIIGLSGYTFGVVVRHDSPWTTIQELFTDAKAKPGKITYGSPGVGGSVSAGFMQIARREGIDWVDVPFRGSAEATAAILGGYVDLIGDPSAATANPGKLRTLVTWGARRTANWPMVPTLKEAGVNMVMEAPFGLAGPKNMNSRIVQILHDAFKKGMEDPSYTEVLARFDQKSYYLNSENYRVFAIHESAEMKRRVTELGLKQN